MAIRRVKVSSNASSIVFIVLVGIIGITSLGFAISNFVDKNDLYGLHATTENELYELQAMTEKREAIRQILNIHSVYQSQKNISAYTETMLPDTLLDFTEFVSPTVMNLTEYVPLQQFVWDSIIKSTMVLFTNPIIECIGDNNATVETNFLTTFVYYQPPLSISMNNTVFPAFVTSTTAVFKLYKFPVIGWKITYLAMNPGIVQMQVNPTESGGLNNTVFSRNIVSSHSKKSTISDDEMREKYTMIINHLLSLGGPFIAMANSIKMTPDYIRLFPQ